MALPTELDFTKNPAATPARMDEAMGYIVARLRSLEAIQPEFASVINELRGVGLERLTEALLPIFVSAQEIDASLTALQAEYEEDVFRDEQIAAVLVILRDGVSTEFNTLDKMADKIIEYRSKYLGAKAVAPTLDDNGAAVAAGGLYFDTALNRMRVYTGATWQDAGSAVDGILERQDFTATGGETSVTVPGGYDPGNIIVYVNGSVLSEADVVVTSGTSIGLPGALSAGDAVSWTKFGAVTLASVYNKVQADARFMGIAAAYTKAEANALLAARAPQTTTYTKSEVDAAVAAAVSAAVPPSEIKYFARATAPAGYLAASGQTVSRAAYLALFTAIGTTFNIGGESGTDFRLPDLRGEFIRGWDDGRGVDSGRAFGSYQADEIEAHTHSVSPPVASGEGGQFATTTGSAGGGETISPYSTGSVGGTETRPRNIALLGCIKT